MMAINTLRIFTLMPFLTRGFTCDNTKPLQVILTEVVMVAVRAFVLFAGVKVAATLANEMLIAGLQLLDTLNFVAIVFKDIVEPLPFPVALDNVFWLARWTRYVFKWFVGILCRYSGPRP